MHNIYPKRTGRAETRSSRVWGGFFVLFEGDVFAFSFSIASHENKGRLGSFDGKIFDKVVT